MIRIAEEAARRAGAILRDSFGSAGLRVERKGHADFVTEVDRRAEDVVREFLAKELPGHAFLLEESGASGSSDWVWVVDPLDGTTNFIHGYPFFCVSLALRHRGRTLLGVVYDPIRNEMFSAVEGEGTRLDGKSIAVSQVSALDAALVCTGFPFRSREFLEPYLELLRLVLESCGGLRRDGSAALDLAYVAAGRYDAFFELGLCPWDVAAGELLIRQAGGAVSDFSGGEAAVEGGDVVASNGHVQARLQYLVGQTFAGVRPLPGTGAR